MDGGKRTENHRKREKSSKGDLLFGKVKEQKKDGNESNTRVQKRREELKW